MTIYRQSHDSWDWFWTKTIHKTVIHTPGSKYSAFSAVFTYLHKLARHNLKNVLSFKQLRSCSGTGRLILLPFIRN